MTSKPSPAASTNAVGSAGIPTWTLRGNVVLACNCDYGCPCNFNGLPTTGKCEGNWNWHIDQGDFGGVSLSGLNVTLTVNWPKAIHDGNGDGVAIIDERADQRQRDALRKLIVGEAGGPWKIIRTTIGTLHGPEYAPFDVKIDGYASRVTVGKFVTLQMEPVKNPVTKVDVHPRIVLPEGFVFKEGQLGASSVFKVSGPVSFDHSGRYAAVGPFQYQGP
jgi:hypothetical protein